MKSQKTKFSALFPMLLLLVVSLISFACQSPSSSSSDSNMHKVTIDTNGGIPSSTSSKDVKDGETLSLSDAELPTLTDKSIAYWSTSKDDYTTVFTFGTTKVTGDITIYPHWRTSITAIKKMFDGYWLYRDVTLADAQWIYKIDSAKPSFVQCRTTVGLDLKLVENGGTLNILKNMAANPIYTVGNGQTIPNDTATYNVTGNDATFFTLRDSSIQRQCNYGSKIGYSLKDYVAPNNNDITLNRFYPYGSVDITDKIEEITLKSYTSDKITFEVTNSVAAGTKILERAP